MVGKYPGAYEAVKNSIAFNMYADFSERDYALVAGYTNDDTGIPPVINLSLVNNIFAFNTGPGVGDRPTGIYLGVKVHLTENHNLVFSREDGEIQAPRRGPMPSADSPATVAGTSAPYADILGSPRPQGSADAVGTYER